MRKELQILNGLSFRFRKDSSSDCSSALGLLSIFLLLFAPATAQIDTALLRGLKNCDFAKKIDKAL